MPPDHHPNGCAWHASLGIGTQTDAVCLRVEWDEAFDPSRSGDKASVHLDISSSKIIVVFSYFRKSPAPRGFQKRGPKEKATSTLRSAGPGGDEQIDQWLPVADHEVANSPPRLASWEAADGGPHGEREARTRS